MVYCVRWLAVSDCWAASDGWLCQMVGCVRWLVVSDGWLCHKVGYVRWLVVSDGWLCQMVGYVRWLAVSDGWLCQMVGCVRWLAVSDGWLEGVAPGNYKHCAVLHIEIHRSTCSEPDIVTARSLASCMFSQLFWILKALIQCHFEQHLLFLVWISNHNILHCITALQSSVKVGISISTLGLASRIGPDRIQHGTTGQLTRASTISTKFRAPLILQNYRALTTRTTKMTCLKSSI